MGSRRSTHPTKQEGCAVPQGEVAGAVAGHREAVARSEIADDLAVGIEIAAIGIIQDREAAAVWQQLCRVGDMSFRQRRIGGDEIRERVDREDYIVMLAGERGETGAVAYREIDIAESGTTPPRRRDHAR